MTKHKTVALQAPLSMGFPRQEYWNGLPCPSPVALPDPGIEPTSPVSIALQADSLPLSNWEAHKSCGMPCPPPPKCRDEEPIHISDRRESPLSFLGPEELSKECDPWA